MKNRTVLYTANAGFFLAVNHISLAVDAFPRKADRGFSALTQNDFEALCQRSDLGDVRYVIATHDHPDHYSQRWTEQFLATHPHARFIGAVREERAPFADDGPNTVSTASPLTSDPRPRPLLLQGDHPTYYLPGITLEFLRLPHEGEEFAAVANYGCLVTFAATKSVNPSSPHIVGAPTPASSSGLCRVLFLGDAKPSDPAIADRISGRSIDLALLNFPWITLPKGRRFLEASLPNTEIAVLHLPYEQEDRNHYNQAAEQTSRQWRPGHVTLLTSFGQTIRF